MKRAADPEMRAIPLRSARRTWVQTLPVAIRAGRSRHCGTWKVNLYDIGYWNGTVSYGHIPGLWRYVRILGTGDPGPNGEEFVVARLGLSGATAVLFRRA